MNVIELYKDPLPIDFQEQADHWIELVVEEMKRNDADVGGYATTYRQASADFRLPNHELCLNGMNGVAIDLPLLKIAPVRHVDNLESTALYLALASDREISKSDVEIWRTALDRATTRLKDESPEHKWAAVLGQANDITGKKYALRKKVNIGGVIIRAGGRQHLHFAEGPHPHILSETIHISWPVVVEGTSRGYNWHVASRQAGLETHRVAMLLSLAWGSTWYLLHSPFLAERGELTIPPTNRHEMKNIRFPHPKSYKQIPKWVEQAWATLDHDDNIRNATNAFYQGLLMEDKHPSYALIAFVGSIESIGRKILGDKCACCGKRTSYNQRFKAGVDEVISDKRRAKRLYRLYDSRSGTAHNGELYADEDTIGSFPMQSMFVQTASDAFIFSDLRAIKAVARDLMTKALKGKIKYV